MIDNRFTVVMNGYKRSYAAKEQYEAYRNQSVGSPEFLFWGNTPDGMGSIPFDRYVVDGSTSAICNKNLGVWARFAFALNARTPYVCIPDDDTIPGKRWLENCVDTFHEIKDPCILTPRGVRLNNNHYPQPNSYQAIGWCSKNENIEKVDFGGHCWVFPKAMLNLFWSSAPDVLPLNFGEDIHISVMPWLRKKFETFVPPHPENNTELWGSLKASEYGEDEHATSRLGDASRGMFEYVNWSLKSGYIPVNQRDQESSNAS